MPCWTTFKTLRPAALPDLRGKLPIAPRPGKPDLRYCVVLEGVAPARP